MGVLSNLINFLFAGVFALGAYVQQNDPDPAPWIAIYSIPAAVALLSLARVPHLQYISLLTGVAALLWAGTLLPIVIAQYQKVGSVKTMLLGKTPQFKMTAGNGAVEEAREFGGLLLLTLYCIVLYPLLLKPAEKAAKKKKSE